MLLNMAIMKLTKQLINQNKIERKLELTRPDLISFNCKDSLEMENKVLLRKVRNMVKVLSHDVGGFIKMVDTKLEELHGMVNMFRIDTKTASYRDMVGDEVRCKVLEWKEVVRNIKCEYKKWRSLSLQDQLLLIQLELDLNECKYSVSIFVETFEVKKSNLKGNSSNQSSSPISRQRVDPEVAVDILVDLQF